MLENRVYTYVLIIVLSLAAFGCTNTINIHRESIAQDISAWGDNIEGPRWTQYANNAISQLGQELLNTVPADIELYCPNYANLNLNNRQQYWVSMISALAYFESNFSSAVSYQESFNDSQGKPVISRGLLQISKESANSYGCDILDEKELHDPKVNIYCGVRILNQWIAKQDGVISDRKGWWIFKSEWLGAARYWSPFRNESKRKSIAISTSKQPYCSNDNS